MKRTVNTLVIGSGAAGLAAALRLKSLGVDDVLLLSEGLNRGTSINTGSDKQTYYKLGIYGAEPDSPVQLAQTLFEGGSAHGDVALVEAAQPFVLCGAFNETDVPTAERFLRRAGLALCRAPQE